MTTSTRSHWDVQEWLSDRLAVILRIDRDTVSPGATFSELGLSSIQAVELAAELEDWSGHDVPATFVFDSPTIEDAAAYIVGLSSSGAGARG
ncbi:acyl carrier protein [Nocardiopsis sp. Huas11]|uniref:acyl carrier protein n=1 Tax=Nocardiopsis sp. Huas11 TaxID=2183912 RepID=UPI000EACD1CD|nr:acyl carrier protein [Nocardiopsis sp. Huas11]RKS10370.1 acyl carrier protein [Nocardiopsis sp. Huas11]